jgi:DNA (cytosine-5)-methyltransferase 1
MRYLSVCSGIEAATVAWHPLGWTPAGFAEIEPFPRAVLEQRHGAVAVDWDHRWQEGQNFAPMFGDFTKIGPEHVGPVDLLVGGTPCQSFSIAGKRLGLDDPRGNLAIEFLALAKRISARWLVWENVPGVYSSWSGEPDNDAIAQWDETADFAEFLNLFRECGYRGAWRTVDAQYVRVDGFGRAVPQRRRRCFLVGHSGNDGRAVPVLFDPESLRGLAEPRRTTGQSVAGSLGGDPDGDSSDGGPGLTSSVRCDQVANTLQTTCHDYSRADGFNMVAEFDPNAGRPAGTFRPFGANGSGGPSGDECQNLVAVACGISSDVIDRSGEGADGSAGARSGLGVTEELSPTIRAKRPNLCVAPVGKPFSGGVAPTVNGWTVRKMTPRECERLQGFPDDFTAIQWRGKSAPDGPRYKAIGNSMAVNVMRWIGARIALVERAVEEAAGQGNS